MKTSICIALAFLLIASPMRVNAGDAAAEDSQSVFFPPDAATCVNGAQNLLVWDGVYNVYCVPVPTCKPYQILYFDGHTLTCTPTP
jgi:hypothetical protein